MTAPLFRSLDQQTGEHRPSAFFEANAAADDRVAELAKLRSDLDDARAELDDAMSQLRTVTDSNAGLAKFANVYHIERDEMRERADEYADHCRAYLATIDELQAEVRELRTELSAARSERDTANARAAVL